MGINEIGEVEFTNRIQAREYDEERIDEHGLEAVKENNNGEPLNGHDEIAELKVNDDQLRDSYPIVHTAETGYMELVDKLQDSHASKYKNNGSKVTLCSKSIEQIPCNGADENGTKSKSSRSSQLGSTRESLESNGKGIQKSGRKGIQKSGRE